MSTYRKIDRCICFNISFQEIKEKIESENINIEEAKRSIPCCTRCRLCRPYLSKIVESGRVSFDVGEVE